MITTKWVKKAPKEEYNEFEDIKTILARIHDIKQPKRFLNPCEFELYSPELLKNCHLAVNRIVKAINNEELISIHVDVDSDGVTSGALMYNYLKNFTNKVTYFHAQRSDGHGIEISENDVPSGTNLLIIIDSSTNSVETCKRISTSGVDIIVLDHHEQDNINPYCILVNPQQDGCNYPNKSISGAVVAWKVCRALDSYYKTKYANDYYDIVAIGLVGDVMSLREYENRYIVREGINNIKNIGLRSLLKASKKDPNKITVSDIGYLIAPNINAACRMDKIEVILELITETDEVKANELAHKVLELNEERKRLQKYYYEKLRPLVNENDKCSFIIDNEIGKGFRGLVAGVLSEEFQKPVIIMSMDHEGIYSGSFRSYDDCNFKKILNDIPEVIEAAGHKTVGGVKFKSDDLEVVKEHLNKVLLGNQSEKHIEYVLELLPNEIDKDLVKSIQEFYEISGQGFETGRFLIKGVETQKKVILGKDKNTIKIECNNIVLMKFRTDESYFDDYLIGKNVDVVGTLNLNEWVNPRTRKAIVTTQLFLDDYKIHN
ncbi:hypothetical protein GCM10023310_69050 [Paenibacillus vulneris]|uniref:DHH family phosphoesterase n=1 Tax=Paenibacillus vulneris TaxID=1133364 RepID=A0ABW3UJE5_9BACL